MDTPSPTKKHVRIASRGSPLAMWQARFVQKLLLDGGFTSEIMVVKTTGDIVQDRFLHEIGGKGLFVKELETALRDGRADIAVHSLKDMPVNIDADLCLGAILKRHPPGDVLILREDLWTAGQRASVDHVSQLRTLGKRTIGSSSLRRQKLLEQGASDLTLVPMRGNVDTRIAKLKRGDFDGIILAEASLHRLGEALDLTKLAVVKLDEDWFTPCAGQGALAIECRKGEGAVQVVKPLNCDVTARAIAMERGVLRALGGDCTMPFGSFAKMGQSKNSWVLDAIVLGIDGTRAQVRVEGVVGSKDQEQELVDKALGQLVQNRVIEVLTGLKLKIPAAIARFQRQ